MVNNADWLDELRYIPFLRDVGRHFSVNRMLTLDSVRLRLEREQPLSFLEFNYMILQAYDFVELARRFGCEMQMGGSDQWGNIVSGVELARRIDGRSLFGLTTPLITTASGAKMGKSAQGAVWLNADRLSPYEYWQFWRNTEDADVGRFLRLFTELPLGRDRTAGTAGRRRDQRGEKGAADRGDALAHGRGGARGGGRDGAPDVRGRPAGEDLPHGRRCRARELERGGPAFELLARRPRRQQRRGAPADQGRRARERRRRHRGRPQPISVADLDAAASSSCPPARSGTRWSARSSLLRLARRLLRPCASWTCTAGAEQVAQEARRYRGQRIDRHPGIRQGALDAIVRSKIPPPRPPTRMSPMTGILPSRLLTA